MTSTITGWEELQQTLKTLPVEIQRTVLREALPLPATKLASTAARNARAAGHRSGALAFAMGYKITTSRRVPGRVTAAVGPTRGIKAMYRGKPITPTRYAHLLEYGHAVAGGGTVAARPWLRPAIAAHQGSITGDLAVGIQTGLAKALRKTVRKNSRAKKS